MGTESGEIEEGENNDETGKDEETGIDKGEDGGDGEDKEDSGDDDSEGEGGEGDDGAGERLDVILRENSELKRSIISQQEQLNYMTASMEKHNELLKEKGIISDDDIEQVDPNVEKMQKMQDSIEET
ncbi:MAG TPA: hypothetical protein ENI76_03865, partial [Ignavibacteria bacterium]|nr:hypothetical protein [Ignavibacteria bacterium]